MNPFIQINLCLGIYGTGQHQVYHNVVLITTKKLGINPCFLQKSEICKALFEEETKYFTFHHNVV